jgi:hypothetical protein
MFTMRRSFSVIKSVFLLFLLAAPVVSQSSITLSQKDLPRQLASYKAGHKSLNIQLWLEAYRDDQSQLTVRLTEGADVLATQTMAWPLSPFPYTQDDADKVQIEITQTRADSIDTFQFALQGREESGLDLEISPINLKNTDAAFLFKQTGGFDNVSHNYELYYVADKQLHLGFRTTINMAIQQYSFHRIEDIDKDGFDNVIVSETWQLADADGIPDNKYFHIYPLPKKVEVYAVILASSASISELLSKRDAIVEAEPHLTYELLIINSSEYKRLTPNLYFMGDLIVGRGNAVARLKQLKFWSNISEAYIKRAQ